MCNLSDDNCIGDEYHMLFKYKNVSTMNYWDTCVEVPTTVLCELTIYFHPRVIFKLGAFLKNTIPLFNICCILTMLFAIAVVVLYVRLSVLHGSSNNKSNECNENCVTF